MNIDQHISKLLFKHDCVILPGFGGFVGNYCAARVHPINHTFYPPSKNILFNSKLTGDDGLLTHSLSVSENILYEEAKAVLKSFTKECENNLKDGKNLNFDKIGTIRKDIEGSLLFSQDNTINYLEESYGLASFVSHPIIRQKIHKQLEKKFIDRKPDSERHKKKRAIYIAYLAIIPILFLLGWYILPIGNDNNSTQESSIGISTDLMDEPVLVKKEISKENIEIAKDKIEENLQPNEELHSEVSSSKDIPGTKSAIFQEKKPNYFIIGGAFQYEANSQKLIAQLHLKGYDAEYAGLSRHGLHMVCYLKTEDKNEALMNLAIIRKQDNSTAWLLKRK